MSDITISYKGSSIATMDATGTKTLLTEGKYCEDDITIDYVKSGGSGGATKIAEGTATGGDGNTLSISVGKKMAQKDFIVLLTAPNGTTVAYNTTYKNVNSGIVVDGSFVEFDLSQDVSGASPTGKYTFHVDNSGTVTNYTPQTFGSGYNLRNATLGSNGTNTAYFKISRASTGFTIAVRVGTASYISTITYSWKILYYGSNPTTDIVEVA